MGMQGNGKKEKVKAILGRVRRRKEGRRGKGHGRGGVVRSGIVFPPTL